jgi:hypothetical protein
MTQKLRVWDNALLSHTYEISMQMEVQIRHMMLQLSSEDLSELPHSMVPTKTLYELAVSNDLMYNMLLDNDLIKSGNKKQEPTKHH